MSELVLAMYKRMFECMYECLYVIEVYTQYDRELKIST